MKTFATLALLGTSSALLINKQPQQLAQVEVGATNDTVYIDIHNVIDHLGSNDAQLAAG